MLKLKANVNFEELEQFGFHRPEDSDEWYFDFRPYKEHSDYSYLVVNEETGLLDMDYVEDEDQDAAMNKVYDLITSGLFEKVEG